MHNYCLSKQIYTVAFFVVAGVWCSSLGVWLADGEVLSPCNVLWCSPDASSAHWAANGPGSVARDGGGYSTEPPPPPPLLCFHFVMLFLVCLSHGGAFMGFIYRGRTQKTNSVHWKETNQMSDSNLTRFVILQGVQEQNTTAKSQAWFQKLILIQVYLDLNDLLSRYELY